MDSSSGPSSLSAAPTDASRGRGRGKSRGGLGKYLRASGRRGSGRPAEWGKRLVLEGEGEIDPEELEEISELEKRFSKRQLGTNADRYAEEEPVLNSDGEEVLEPEVDLSEFLAKQKLTPDEDIVQKPPDDDEEIDHSLAHLSTATAQPKQVSKKGQVQKITWDKDLEEMSREKAIAEANWELKSRFRSEASRQRTTRPSDSVHATRGKKQATFTEAPPLPTEQAPKGKMEEMEEFLDDLLG